jgi:hypothetical protein
VAFKAGRVMHPIEERSCAYATLDYVMVTPYGPLVHRLTGRGMQSMDVDPSLDRVIANWTPMDRAPGATERLEKAKADVLRAGYSSKIVERQWLGASQVDLHR